MILRAYRFELDPNETQRVRLAKTVGASRFVYNWGLEQSMREYKVFGRRPKLKDLKSRLVELKPPG
jgi:putative transposase